MKPNPYAWDSHFPIHPLPRKERMAEILKHLRHGRAVKIVGGRGMGKSVLLHQLETALRQESGIAVVLVDSPPEETSIPGAVRDLAERLGIHDLANPSMSNLLEHVLQADVMQLVVLLDETDQYVVDSGFARSWLNKLEATRKAFHSLFDIVFAGGLGLLYLEHEIGSGLVSRAEKCLLDPFGPAEIVEIAQPFEQDGRPLDETCIETLRVLSGGIPALVTYGLQHLWEAGVPSVRALEDAFGIFRERHDAFIRASRNAVSQRGKLDAPWRVLEVVREEAGLVPLQRLRDACVSQNPDTTIDPIQALDLLCAGGFVRIEEGNSCLSDPVAAFPVASILNAPEIPAGSGDPIECLVQDVSAVLTNLHRFGRDFHDAEGLLHEDVFSSFIAVALRLLGWREIERETIQAAGYTDVKVRLVTQPRMAGHIVIEAKRWRGKAYNQNISKQVDDYRLSDTRHAIAVTLGDRSPAGWPEDYERVCLEGQNFQRRPTPPDLVGWWRVNQIAPGGQVWLTDHLLVQIPKRR